MVKGIHNELNIQITENKLPYICKYCNTKGTDILCKINVRQKAQLELFTPIRWVELF